MGRECNDIEVLAALSEVARAAAGPGNPSSLFEALASALQRVIGYELFTIMAFDEASQEAQRIYTTNASSYPVGGRKAMAMTPWGEAVIRGKAAWIGGTAADIRWAFPDHELIASLGLNTALNLPVLYDDRFLGSANLLHGTENWYGTADIARGAPFAGLLVPAILGWGT